MSTAFPPDDEHLDSTQRAAGSRNADTPRESSTTPPRFDGPTPRSGGHGDIAGHYVAGLRLCALGEPDTPLPPQFITCAWLMDHAPSGALRHVTADPPISACGRHLVEMEIANGC